MCGKCPQLSYPRQWHIRACGQTGLWGFVLCKRKGTKWDKFGGFIRETLSTVFEETYFMGILKQESCMECGTCRPGVRVGGAVGHTVPAFSWFHTLPSLSASYVKWNNNSCAPETFTRIYILRENSYFCIICIFQMMGNEVNLVGWNHLIRKKCKRQRLSPIQGYFIKTLILYVVYIIKCVSDYGHIRTVWNNIVLDTTQW